MLSAVIRRRSRTSLMPPASWRATAVEEKVEENPALVAEVTGYLREIGGRCTAYSLQARYKQATLPFLKANFDFRDSARKEDCLVSLPLTEDRVEAEAESLAQRVARHLFRLGGSGDLHDVTRRFGISRRTVLAFGEGKLFEATEDGQLQLSGGAGLVARAAAARGAASIRSGRRRSSADLLTSTGAAVDDAAARRLLVRVEGLLTSAGDGRLPAQAVYAALGLRPCPALRRWFRRSGLRMMGNGDLRVADDRLTYFRVRRGITAAVLVAEADGHAPLPALLGRIHQPPELAALEGQEQRAGPRRLLPLPATPLLPAPGGAATEEEEAAAAAAGPPEAAEEEEEAPDAMAWLAQATLLRPPGGGYGSEVLALARREVGPGEEEEDPPDEEEEEGPRVPTGLSLALVRPPAWVEEWVREHFDVESDGSVTWSPHPEAARLARQLALRGPGGRPPPSISEEQALVMNVEEELRLRYGRAHISVLTGCMEGMRKNWLERFFDTTMYGDIVQKSAARQTRDAIGVTRSILASGGAYSADEAFGDFGVSISWLRKFFQVAPDGALALDPDAERVWQPHVEERAPSPYSYNKLDAPRGYIRKGNGRYLPRKYGHSAGGILY